MDSKLPFTVEERLNAESLRRGVNGTFPQFVMLIAMMILMPAFPGKLYYNVISSILFTILVVRWIIYKKAKNPTELLVTRFPWGITIGLTTAVLWACLVSIAIYYFGVNSVFGINHIYITCALLTAVMYSLSPTPKMQRMYILILGASLSFVIYFHEASVYRYTGIVLLLFVSYLIMASRSHSSDIRSAFEFEEKLSVENLKLQEVVDSVPGFMILVSEKGKWLKSSHSSKEILMSRQLEIEIDNFLKSGLDKKVMELDLSLQDEHCFVVSFEKVRSVDGGIIVFGLPIGDLKKMRQQLEIQKTKAEFASRMAGIGMLASGVAHEINNPLAVISMNTETLTSRLQKAHVDESIWSKKTQIILDTVNRIAKIIKSLQQLSREDVVPQKEDAEINSIIKDVIDVSTERSKNLGAEVIYEEKGPQWVKCKYVELGQVIMGLINNSFDAIKRTKEKKIFIETREAGNDIIIEIKDTGEGVSPEDEKHLFQPFFSTKPVGSGIGLGLSISRSIILSYGGSISLLRAKNPTIFQLKLSKT